MCRRRLCRQMKLLFLILVLCVFALHTYNKYCGVPFTRKNAVQEYDTGGVSIDITEYNKRRKLTQINVKSKRKRERITVQKTRIYHTDTQDEFSVTKNSILTLKDMLTDSSFLKYLSSDTIQENPTNPLLKNECVSLQIPGSELVTPICVYDPKEDKWISSSLRAHGYWEWDTMYQMKSFLSKGTYLLDLGCNIGVFTLMAARLGHNVVAVDPLKKSLWLLSRSLILGNLTSKVILLHNAIGDKVELVSLQEERENIGGTFIQPEPEFNIDDKDHTAMSVTLDHLIPLLANETVVLKMDIESYEWKALKGGYGFFRNVNVKCVFMEWDFHRNNQNTASSIINFMKYFGFDPFSVLTRTRLSYNTFSVWPGDIIWIPK